MKYRLKRDLTNQEKVVADENLKKGDVIYRYPSCTYGCISPSGTACTLVLGVTPFFEVPMDAIEKVEE